MSTQVNSWDWSTWSGDPIGLSKKAEARSWTQPSPSGAALGAVNFKAKPTRILVCARGGNWRRFEVGFDAVFKDVN